jgi:hypothetical protein
MKLFQNISLGFLLTFFFFCHGCQSKTGKTDEELGKENAIQDTETTNQTSNIIDDKSESEPISCIDWIGFYTKATRELDSIVNRNAIKVKSEGFDKYNSANKLEGAYVLKDKNMPIDRIGSLAKYLAYKLCLSDNKKFNGVLMDCQRRKIQVVIARSEKNYTNEAWAVVYNIFPANKKGELITLDFTK